MKLITFRSLLFVIAFITLFSIIYYFARLRIGFSMHFQVQKQLSNWTRTFDLKQLQNKHGTNKFNDLSKNRIVPSSLFLYRAYIDQRTFPTRIRVFSINMCLDKRLVIMGAIRGKYLTFQTHPIEGDCPWKWANGCKYNSYILESIDNLNSTYGDMLTLFLMNRNVSLILLKISDQKEKGLTICVPPIYWLSDWTKMILFVETWRAHGAEKIIIYYHSSTKQIRSVLEHYEKIGFVEIIPWPLLPSSRLVDPNISVYRLAHSLAHNDCLMRINTEYGALVDIDEMLVPKESSLLNFISKKFGSDENIGALSFSHITLNFYPPLVSNFFAFKELDYRGVISPSTTFNKGPPKMVFRSAAVDLLSTHQIIRFNGNWKSEKVPLEKGLLLHNRYNWAAEVTPHQKNISFLPASHNIESFRKLLVRKKHLIFPNGAQFNYNTQRILGNCLQRWRETQNNCKTPLWSCYKQMMSMEKWDIVKSTTQNGFHAL